jgi:hypothetical protein
MMLADDASTSTRTIPDRMPVDSLILLDQLIVVGIVKRISF